MSDQLELDLVAPGLAGRSPDEEQLLTEAEDLVRQAKQKFRQAKILAELRNQDLVLAPQPTNELEELRLLIGKESWKKQRRRWERRLKRDVRQVRKVLIVLRNLFTHQPYD